MPTRTELVELARALRGTKALSVYLAPAPRDVSERVRWRRALERAIDAERELLGEQSRADRAAFEHCARALVALLPRVEQAADGRGWAGFFTERRVEYFEPLSGPVPTLVVWDYGLHIAPYLRALDDAWSAVVAVVDARTARLYRYADGALRALETIHAAVRPPRAQHMGGPPRPGFHPGTRGEARVEATQRVTRAGWERMSRVLSAHLAALASPDDAILVGGIAERARDAIAALPTALRRRARLAARLDVHAPRERIAAAAARGAAELRGESECALVGDVLDRAAAGRAGVVGIAPALAAAREHAVETLCVSDRFLADCPHVAERVVASAVADGADVRCVRGAAAERLDASAAGVAARLRFAPAPR